MKSLKFKILSVLAVLGLLVILVLQTMPVQAEVSEPIPTLTEKLDPGWTRMSPYETTHVTGIQGTTATTESVITAGPTTLDDNKTLIDNSWYLQVDPAGQKWFQNGNNIFASRVTADNISVLDKKGRITDYSSALSMQNTYKGGMPSITDDPLNGAKNNSLVWNYGKYGKGSVLTRYLRSNNARLSELWVLTGVPNTDLIFRPNMTQEQNYGATTIPLFAFDAKWNIIPIAANTARGFYTIKQSDLVNASYPVYVDPTYDFTWWSDAWIESTQTTYNAAWTALSGYVINGDYPAWIGQECTAGISYEVDKSYVVFYTGTLPSNLNVTSAYIYLYGYQDESDTDFNIEVCNGQPSYPSIPPVAADFNKSLYTTDSGSSWNTVSGWYNIGYNTIIINNTGFITKGTNAYTKLALRSDREISGIAPTGYERVSFWQGEHGSSFQPSLRVIGTVPITVPVVTTNTASSVTTTSATLNGYLSNDGGASCSTQFQYGTTIGYGTTTAWIAGYNTNQTFSSTVAGLVPGTLYHFRAAASNSAGTGFGSDTIFTAVPRPPTFFSAIGGATQISLSWTGGTGANTTVVVRKTGSYPANPTDGTTVYSSTGSSFVDSPLTNGTVYYYGAWSLAADSVTYSLTSAQGNATPSALTTPTVVTGAASGVTATAATLQGNLTNMGGYGTVDVNFDWGKTLAYELGPTAPVAQTPIGTYTAALAGLDPATLYHFRAKAANANPGSPIYGADATFTTSAPSAPTMTTNAATGVQIASVQLNGTVTSDGGSPPVTIWFKYGLTPTYELGSTPTAAGLYTGGTFYYGLGDLAANTLYHFQAVGQNSLGTSYGSDQTFTTATPTLPTVVSNSATSVGAVQVTLQGTLTVDGGTSCTLSFEYGITAGYGMTVTATPATGTGGTAYSALITGLVVGQLYHFRADATNLGGTGSGTDQTFTTVFGAPTNLVATAYSSSTINLSWVLQGDQTFINYSTSGYPVDRAQGTQVYFGTGTTAAVSGLIGGTTYYFSAWSWKTGDVWTQTNANAIATTFASTMGNQIPAPTVPVNKQPLTPTSWFNVPSNAVIRNFPLYDVFTGWATAYQVPEGTFWAFIALLLSTVIGGLAFITFRMQAVPAVAASLVVVIICGLVQMCPPIFAMFIGAIEIGGAYGLMSLGGNISGRGV